jgi:kynurenine formamidase
MARDEPTETFREIGARLSNWGRWGPADERGTMNLIGPEQILRAAAAVTRGEVISLGVDLNADGPIPPGFGKRSNPIHIMTELGQEPRVRGDQRFADDYLMMPLQAATQWDALAHIIYDDKIYNGYVASQHITVDGAGRCSIDRVADGVVGRGILLDVARHRGVDWLQIGDVIEPEELDAVAATQGTELLPGDVLLIRTGWWSMYLATRDRSAYFRGEPGLGLRCAQWLSDRQVAAVCSDNFSVEAIVPGDDGRWASPEVPDQAFVLHMVLTRDMGMMFGEIFDLEALGAACADDGTYEFLFSAPPLRVTGGVGSPLNPLAVR